MPVFTKRHFEITPVQVLLIGLMGFLFCVSGTTAIAQSKAQSKKKSKVDNDGNRLVYKTVGERDLALTVIKPKDWKPTDSRPAVVFYHGGGWVGGKPGQFNGQGAYLAELGMVAVLVEYRLLQKPDHSDRKIGREPPTDCIHDAKSAMRYVRSNANKLGIDPERIAAGGGSAGGHLAAFLGTTDGVDDPQDDLSVSARPNAMLLFNPVYDNGPGGWATNRVKDRFQEFSPMHNISKDDAPSIVFLGTKDQLIPVETVKKFQQKMQAVGVRSELRLYEEATHGFFNKSRDNGKWYRKTVAETHQFLKELGWVEGEPDANELSSNESANESAQQNWPGFRGAKADGVGADNEGLPLTWSTTENVHWSADVAGWGWSCPVVWGDKVFLTAVVGDEANTEPSKGLYLGEGVRDPAKGMHHWMVYCLDLNTGKELWKQEAHTGQPKVPRHPKSSYAAETTVTDGERLYVLFGDLGLYCFGLDGKPIWSKEIEPKKTLSDWGAASSPVVHDGKVFVLYDNLESSWLACFDGATGDELWKKDREETKSWSTPFIWENELRTEIVVPGCNFNRSYSLDGEVLWQFDGDMSGLVIPSPFAAHGMCYISSGYIGDAHRPTFAIKPGATGDITPAEKHQFVDNEFVEWYDGRSSSYNPSQLVFGDYLYTLYDRGFLTCHNAKTGEEMYGKQRFTPKGSFTSSPFAYNGHVFCLSEEGLTYCLKAGPEFELVGTNELDELCLASPAIVGDKVLVRTVSKLYCLSKKTTQETGR